MCTHYRLFIDAERMSLPTPDFAAASASGSHLGNPGAARGSTGWARPRTPDNRPYPGRAMMTAGHAAPAAGRTAARQ